MVSGAKVDENSGASSSLLLLFLEFNGAQVETGGDDWGRPGF